MIYFNYYVIFNSSKEGGDNMVSSNEVVVRNTFYLATGLSIPKLPRNQWTGQEVIDVVTTHTNTSISEVLEALEELGYNPSVIEFLAHKNK